MIDDMWVAEDIVICRTYCDQKYLDYYRDS